LFITNAAINENVPADYTAFNPTNYMFDHKYFLFCDAPTHFGPYRPSSGRSFIQEYIYNTCCHRCAYMELKYNVINKNIAKNVSNVD
jgi:hypothetical protein